MENNILNYFAGIVDGEGTIGVSKAKRNNKRGFAYNPFFSITNTHLPMLEYIQKHIGGRIVFLDDRTLCYSLTFNSKVMKELLPELIPLLIIKREQAEIVLKFLQKKEELNLRLPSDGDIEYFEWCYQECKRLKLVRYNYSLQRVPVGIRKCKQCSKDFLANSFSQKYCSKYCKKNARWIRSNETIRIKNIKKKEILKGNTIVRHSAGA